MIEPAAFEIEIGDGESLDVSGCCPALEEGEEIGTTLDAEFGEIGIPEGAPTNCGDSRTYPYTPPEFECEDLITAVVTWSDTGTCTAYATATVVEPENDD